MNNNLSFSTVLKTGFVAGVIAAIANLGVWVIGQIAGGMVVPFIAVPIASLVGVLIGGVLYFILSRLFGARTNFVFTIISVIFLVANFFGPISAMSSEAMPGMGLFNLPTVIATEIMHLVAGGLAITRYTKLMRN
ncbi:MAG: hypothetical protein KGS46_14415 [Chloroflexi bacterium]|nr:hypothetical protein [Chloroflexota bacterium]